MINNNDHDNEDYENDWYVVGNNDDYDNDNCNYEFDR